MTFAYTQFRLHAAEYALHEADVAKEDARL
jgi:hypothetical protein